jgi:hypothetical protein
MIRKLNRDDWHGAAMDVRYYHRHRARPTAFFIVDDEVQLIHNGDAIRVQASGYFLLVFNLGYNDLGGMVLTLTLTLTLIMARIGYLEDKKIFFDNPNFIV